MMNLNNIDYILKKAKNIANPKEALKQALLELEKKDAGTARMLCEMIFSGSSPVEAIKKFSKEGKININNISKIKNGYYLLRRMGLKISVPDSVWDEIQNTNSKEIPEQIKEIPKMHGF